MVDCFVMMKSGLQSLLQLEAGDKEEEEEEAEEEEQEEEVGFIAFSSC